MKKSAGAKRAVLRHVRPSHKFEIDRSIPSAKAKPTGKPGKKRKVIGDGNVARGGQWVGVMPH